MSRKSIRTIKNHKKNRPFFFVSFCMALSGFVSPIQGRPVFQLLNPKMVMNNSIQKNHELIMVITFYRKALSRFIFTLIFTGFTFTAFAQSAGPVKIGTMPEFLSEIIANANDSLILETTSEAYQAKVTSINEQSGQEVVKGYVNGDPSSPFKFSVKNGILTGSLLLVSEGIAYRYYSEDSNVYVEQMSINEFLCDDFPRGPEVMRTLAEAPPAGSEVYDLESLPGATAVAKLDFDGEYVVSQYWNDGNPIDAQPSAFTESEIIEMWEMISEDFRPFNINITTSEEVFQAAPVDSRVRCIFTPTDVASPGDGGVAWRGSFTYSVDVPCWVFNSSVKTAGEAGSHEIGHTLELHHDGTITGIEYYEGHGIWAPIMGVGYYSSLVQLSQGEYENADNMEDDISIIAGPANGFGFRADVVGDSPGTATALQYDEFGNVEASDNYSIIEQQLDLNVYSFTLPSGGTVNLTVNPAEVHPNLDVLAALTNSAGEIIQIADPYPDLSATITATVPAGTYYLTVDGTGFGNPETTGYSDYGSLGEYTVSGSIPAAFVVGINGPSCVEAGVTYTYTLNPDPDTNIEHIHWWVDNGDALVVIDENDRRTAYVTFSEYNSSGVLINAGVNYNISPWWQEYSNELQFGGCTAGGAADARIATAPHPFDTETSLTVTNGEKILNATLYDLQGREVMNTGQVSSEELRLGNGLNAGVYIIQIKTEKGVYTRNLIKTH